jgi:hypothetical protein
MKGCIDAKERESIAEGSREHKRQNAMLIGKLE